MAAEIQPGSVVTVSVSKTPSNEKAAKTLSRIFAKDPVNVKAKAVRKEHRANATVGAKRGGRIWYVRPKAPRLVQPEKGATCKVRATVDVIRDLGSVSRFVSVK